MLFEKGDKILFIGDSISDYERARPVGEGLFGAWGTSYVANVGSLLTCTYPSLGLRVVNMGSAATRRGTWRPAGRATWRTRSPTGYAC